MRFSVFAHGRKASDYRCAKMLSRLVRFHAVKCGRSTHLSDYG
jgi:hypothetical protein